MWVVEPLTSAATQACWQALLTALGFDAPRGENEARKWPRACAAAHFGFWRCFKRHQLAASACEKPLLMLYTCADAENDRAHAIADSGFSARWIEGHQLAAAAIGKPLLMEEFGKIATGDASNFTAERDPIYK